MVQLQEIIISPIDFNDFTSNSGHSGIDLGSFGGCFGVISSIWVDCGSLSEPIRRRKARDGKCDGYMWELGGALWIYFGALWCHLGATLGHLGATLGHFGGTLRLVWGNIGMTLGHFGVTLVRL